MKNNIWYPGFVIKGKGRGKKIGFSTINLLVEKNLKIRQGIYFCQVKINNREYSGLLHWGPVPTFKQKAASIEILISEHIKNLELNMPVSFVPKKFLRDIVKFNSAKELKIQIDKDLLALKS